MGLCVPTSTIVVASVWIVVAEAGLDRMLGRLLPSSCSFSLLKSPRHANQSRISFVKSAVSSWLAHATLSSSDMLDLSAVRERPCFFSSGIREKASRQGQRWLSLGLCLSQPFPSISFFSSNALWSLEDNSSSTSSMRSEKNDGWMGTGPTANRRAGRSCSRRRVTRARTSLVVRLSFAMVTKSAGGKESTPLLSAIAIPWIATASNLSDCSETSEPIRRPPLDEPIANRGRDSHPSRRLSICRASSTLFRSAVGLQHILRRLALLTATTPYPSLNNSVTIRLCSASPRHLMQCCECGQKSVAE
mmetsp:Transcript_2725/g.6196  ORF Transcript_2725/g.6196 Transcript_2725/m.6196 type:complete len:304 (-) Transcript_2725:390-1301(-)